MGKKKIIKTKTPELICQKSCSLGEYTAPPPAPLCGQFFDKRWISLLPPPFADPIPKVVFHGLIDGSLIFS